MERLMSEELEQVWKESNSSSVSEFAWKHLAKYHRPEKIVGIVPKFSSGELSETE
jgi:hypothetical protein